MTVPTEGPFRHDGTYFFVHDVFLHSLQTVLNELMGAGKTVWDDVRSRLQELLSSDNQELRSDPALFAKLVLPEYLVVHDSPGFSGQDTLPYMTPRGPPSQDTLPCMTPWGVRHPGPEC